MLSVERRVFPGSMPRFFHEARVMASLRHPNLVAVLDLDEKARRIVLELAAGGTLRDLVRDRGPRTLRRALERHGQVLSALSAAHRRGIIHRDVKPANLMFRRDPDTPGVEVVLGDFGVAHLPDASGATPPPYLSPAVASEPHPAALLTSDATRPAAPAAPDERAPSVSST